MSSLTINFTPASAPPANGYKVQYQVVGDAAYQTVSPNPTTSPVIIPNVVPGSSYQGMIQADCGNGSLSTSANFSASPVFGSTEIGVLIVDINCASTANILGIVNTPGVAENNVMCYPGHNFAPTASSASPDSCDIICSDYTASQNFAKLRFEFNIKKHLAEYPGINTFVYQLLGDDTAVGSYNVLYDLKGANDSTLTMAGSPGSYYPSVINSTYPFTAVPVTLNIGAGANGTYSLALPVIKTFTYDRASKTITVS